MRHLLLALGWYTASYAEAERRMREAQDHRAQLLQTLKQLTRHIIASNARRPRSS